MLLGLSERAFPSVVAVGQHFRMNVTARVGVCMCVYTERNINVCLECLFTLLILESFGSRTRLTSFEGRNIFLYLLIHN